MRPAYLLPLLEQLGIKGAFNFKSSGNYDDNRKHLVLTIQKPI